MRGFSFVLRALLVPFHAALSLVDRMIDLLEQPRYQIRGGCHHNGQCCHVLLFSEHPFLTWPLLRAAVRFWLERVYPFALTETSIADPETGELFRMVRCRVFDGHRCGQYWLRPRVCRSWPRPGHQPPTLFHGCGYWAVDRADRSGADVSRRRSAAEPAKAAALAQRWEQSVSGR